MELISVIIINYNTPAMTENAISRFINWADGFNYEIILIDNNSTKKMSGAFLSQRRIRFIQNTQNIGFAKAVNQGVSIASGDYILLLNSDALVEKDTVKDLLVYLKNNQPAGIIGPRFIYPSGENQVSSGKFPNLWREFFRLFMLNRLLPFDAYNKDFKTVRPVDRVSGGCMLIKREVINRIGLFDEGYFFGAEDMDFCLRAGKSGWQTVYYPLVKLVHYHSFSSGGRKTIQTIKLERNSLDYFFKKNFSKKIISRFLIRQTHNLKILAFSLLGYK